MTTLKELLSVPRFSDLRLLNKDADLSLPVESIEITETPDIASYIPKNIFLLTTAMSFQNDQKGLIRFIDSLIQANAAGLGIKLNRFLGEVHPDVLDYANEKKFPLIEVPGIFPLGSLLHQMQNFLWDTKQEEINYALDIQKTFSGLLMKDANINYFTTELGKMVHTPIILLDPFYKIISYSRHFNHSKDLAEDYAQQIWQHYQEVQNGIDNFLIEGSDGKEVHLAVYPIKVYNHFPHYLVILNPERIPYPISSFAIEQAALVLSFVLFKNLKIEESQQNLRNNVLNRLLGNRGNSNWMQSNVLQMETPFRLLDSSYNQIIFIQYFQKEAMETKLKYNEEVTDLVLQWYRSRLHQRIPNPILVHPVQGDHLVFLLQSPLADLEAFLNSITDELETILPLQIAFFFGRVQESLEKVTESYIEAELAQKSGRSMVDIPRFNYFRPEGLQQLFNDAQPGVIQHFSRSVLKDLAYPKDDAMKELQKTLKFYLDNHCEITKTAQDLFVHRNTVKYRIERCEQIIGKKVSDPTVSLNVRLALELIQSEKSV